MLHANNANDGSERRKLNKTVVFFNGHAISMPGSQMTAGCFWQLFFLTLVINLEGFLRLLLSGIFKTVILRKYNILWFLYGAANSLFKITIFISKSMVIRASKVYSAGLNTIRTNDLRFNIVFSMGMY